MWKEEKGGEERRVRHRQKRLAKEGMPGNVYGCGGGGRRRRVLAPCVLCIGRVALGVWSCLVLFL